MFNKKKLIEEQLKLAEKIVLKEEFSKPGLIAGCDQSFINDNIISVIVVCDKEMNVIEKKHAVVKETSPYVPGFLFYREGLAVIEAFSKLKNKPDVLIIDGNGILHPRRIGMASQIGILLDISTIGISKRLPCGDVKEGKVYVEKEMRGIELKTRQHANPLYVSPGNKISMGKSIEIVKNSIKYPHKLPEPVHIAHRLANNMRKNQP